MSTVIAPNRYNAFLIDSVDPMSKLTNYSCPKCYINTKQKAGMTTMTCIQCHYSGPVIALPSSGTSAPVSAPVGAAARFTFSGATIASKWGLRCPFCQQSEWYLAQHTAFTCIKCNRAYYVDFTQFCSACLVNANQLIPAIYVCSDPGTYHTTAFDKQIGGVNGGAGKCMQHHCHNTCVKK